MALTGAPSLLALYFCAIFLVSTDAVPRGRRSVDDNQDYVTVSTKYGDVRGLTYKVSDDEDLDVFFGIPYAESPVGDLRLARPNPVSPWSPEVKDATEFPNMCMQQNTQAGMWSLVPTSEDCLYFNVYSPRRSDSDESPLPVMLYIHGGSFRNGGAMYYNYTNLALEGVVVVTIAYRLDAFGFLSTQDEVIPGNFGLWDAALALDVVKEVIGDFGGNGRDITIFGHSAGAAITTDLMLSPQTKGKFQKAILHSGAGTCPWASYKEGTPMVPRLIAFSLGERLGCSPPGNVDPLEDSRDLLTCLRNKDAADIVQELSGLTRDWGYTLIFTPVAGDAFNFLPEHPAAMAAKTDQLVPIPTIYGFTTEEMSWMVQDPEDDGVTYDEFIAALNVSMQIFYTERLDSIVRDVLQLYLPPTAAEISELSPFDFRAIESRLRSDLGIRAPLVKEARLFSQAAERNPQASTYVFHYAHRPSYSENVEWHGVTHMDDRGIVMGHPDGPSQFSYPSTSEEDREVADLMMTMWVNFAKYGDPTPQPLAGGVKWPTFGHTSGDQNVLVIRPKLEVEEFDGDVELELWTGDSGLTDADPSEAISG